MTNTNRSLVLDVTKDYIVKLPTDAPLTASGGLIVTGGRNVVLIGGEITIPYQGPTPPAHSRRALYLKGQTGTVHVEGLLINGPDLNEGINLDQRLGATVQIQRVRIDATRARDAADQAANHSDLIQTWAGPSQLRVDHFTGYTGYQGLFLLPTQYNTPAPTVPYELSNLDVIGLPGSGYMAWKSSNLTVNSSSVWLKAAGSRSPSLTAWPSPSAWPGVSYGLQPNGEFVPAGSVGRGYQASDGVLSSPTTTLPPMPTVTQATTTATSMPTTAATTLPLPAPAAATPVTSSPATTTRSGYKKIRSRKR